MKGRKVHTPTALHSSHALPARTRVVFKKYSQLTLKFTFYYIYTFISRTEFDN